MDKLNVLNKKQINEVKELIKKQWGSSPEFEVLLKNSSNRLYIAKLEVFQLSLDALRINSIGIYFGELFDHEIRLSIEGSQIVGPLATKNVIDLNDTQIKEWTKGNDIILDENSEKDVEGMKGFLIIKNIIKNKCDFYGTGKKAKGKIMNFYPKTRRIGL